jgi:hypothetical protein
MGLHILFANHLVQVLASSNFIRKIIKNYWRDISQWDQVQNVTDPQRYWFVALHSMNYTRVPDP